MRLENSASAILYCMRPFRRLVQCPDALVTRGKLQAGMVECLGTTVPCNVTYCVYCDGPMYEDDLSLIATSEQDLQSMLDIVSSYALMWCFGLNV